MGLIEKIINRIAILDQVRSEFSVVIMTNNPEVYNEMTLLIKPGDRIIKIYEYRLFPLLWEGADKIDIEDDFILLGNIERTLFFSQECTKLEQKQL